MLVGSVSAGQCHSVRLSTFLIRTKKQVSVMICYKVHYECLNGAYNWFYVYFAYFRYCKMSHLFFFRNTSGSDNYLMF